jgi:hypothetical protein
MRCLNESLARKANVEDNCKGRFWEGRFKSQALLDEAAILTCMAYVDLNPVRADIAETPEASDYTSIQERIRHYADMLERDVGEPEEKPSETTAVTENPVTTSTDTLSKTAPAGLLPLIGNEHHDQPERAIAFSLQDYLALVDWTGRAIRDDKKGAIPDHLLPILQRLGLDEHAWADNVQHFGQRFHGVIGTADRVRQFSRALGKKWLCGVGSSQGLYRPVAVRS